MSDICVKAIVSGRVQGVCFRANTRDHALAAGITGYAKNLPDGRVEVKACGEKDAVDKLVQWLHQGPDSAKVDDVELSELPLDPPNHFSIR